MQYAGMSDFSFFTYTSVNKADKKMYKNNIFLFLRKLIWEYVNFSDWYDGLFSDDCNLQESREIVLCEKNSHIVGVIILKKTMEEQKICTLRVARKFQKLGIGSKLMEYSFEWLGNEKPMITFHKSKQKEFNSLIKKYNFELNQINKKYYGIFNTELVYNGELPPKKICLGKESMEAKYWDEYSKINFTFCLPKICTENFGWKQEVRIPKTLMQSGNK